MSYGVKQGKREKKVSLGQIFINFCKNTMQCNNIEATHLNLNRTNLLF